jgi:uncharacterized protein (DUF4415 family)
MKSMMSLPYELFPPEKRPPMKERNMKKTGADKAKEIRKLANIKYLDIDLSDIPEVRDWTGAEVGKFYRPIKQPLTLRVDADVLAWLKSQGKGYQTRINEILRAAMLQKTRRRRA